METVPMLNQIDDELHYAQMLEVANVEAYSELDRILQASVLPSSYRAGGPPDDCELRCSYEDLARLRFVMNATVRQSVDRRRRLAHVTRGLADVVLDEEGSKK